MTPLSQFIAYFLVASGVTALVQALVRFEETGRALRAALELFVYVVGGITAFSALVYVLEWAFIRKP